MEKYASNQRWNRQGCLPFGGRHQT
jgi:hypothetical protein